MALSDADRDLIVAELGREPTPVEAALFENLWSEHCAYRSSRPLLSAFDAEGPQVVVGPGDDAAVIALPVPDGDDLEADGNDGTRDSDADGGSDGPDGSDADARPETDRSNRADRPEAVGAEWYVTLGIESHNHPSYVDPYDGAATGVGGIVRDTLSMGAYPIALADCLYFGPFDREHSRYLFEGVVEGIADYGNAIGVPTVTGSVCFHPGYVGNPLVNVACVGLLPADRLVTAVAKRPGNALVLVGNSTGRDGLGGASFASEDLAEDAETEDRPAVQVGDPYAEKLLIEANETLCAAGLVESARDLGAAGLGGASSELVAKGGLGAEIDLERVHQREPNMAPLEILLAESQERMCYEVAPENVEAVRAIADRYELGCSVVGQVTAERYVCTYEGEPVVDLPAELVADGAPTYDRPRATPRPEPPARELPDVDLEAAFATVVGSPNTASKEWVYRQYDHEVGLRTAVRPGADAAVLAIREVGAGADAAVNANPESENGDDDARDPGSGLGLAFGAGAEPNWTLADPYEGARAIALEVATNLAVVGARPLAAVDCLNGGNPETPAVFGAFAAAVEGLAEGCRSLSVPVVGGNVSLYNDSASGPVPPTPTLAMVGTRDGYDALPSALQGEGTVLVVGDRALGGADDGVGDGDTDGSAGLGGSEYLARFDGTDRFPEPPDDPRAFVRALAAVAHQDGTLAAHDVSHGGLAVALAEMITETAGLDASIDGSKPSAVALLFNERAGRAVIETTDPAAVREAFEGIAPVDTIGTATDSGRLELSIDGTELSFSAASIATLRDVIARELR